MITIVQKGMPVLHHPAKLVHAFGGKELKSTIEKMARALFTEPDGVGIAAPQIGLGLRIFLVAADVLDSKALEIRMEANKKKSTPSTLPPYFVFINPRFTKIARKKVSDVEGCLSVRGFYGDVMRPEKVTIEYHDEHGIKKNRGASGLFARVLQHEMDHLEGKLFIEKAKNIKKIPS